MNKKHVVEKIEKKGQDKKKVEKAFCPVVMDFACEQDWDSCVDCMMDALEWEIRERIADEVHDAVSTITRERRVV